LNDLQSFVVVERFLETVNMLGGVEDRKIYEGVDGDRRLP
jgi:hypothetical protein